MRFSEIVKEAHADYRGYFSKAFHQKIAHLLAKKVTDDAVREHLIGWFAKFFGQNEAPKTEVVLRQMMARANREPAPTAGTPRNQVEALAKAIHAEPDAHVREYLAHLLDPTAIVQDVMSSELWQQLCTHGEKLKPAKRLRARPFKSFEQKYRPVPGPNGIWRTAEEVPRDIDDHYVWSCEPMDSGREVLLPGFMHHAQNWIVCEVPFDEAEYSNPCGYAC